MKKGLKITLYVVIGIALLFVGFLIGNSKVGTHLSEIFIGTSTILEDPAASGDPEVK